MEAAAEILFGDERAIIKVDCAEFQHSHEISKLIGSPPGYLKHRERHPLTTQEALARNHRGELKLSFLLFDEIEKASDVLWQLLLLDKLGVFHPLRRERLQEVLQIELRKVQSRVSNALGRPFLFRMAEEARQFLLDAGTDQRYGARHLKRAIESFLISPLATLLATNQLRLGDLLIIDRQPQEQCLAFSKHAEHHVSYPCLPQMDSKCMRRMNAEIQG